MRKWIVGFAVIALAVAAWAAVKPLPLQQISKKAESYPSKANFPVTSPELRLEPKGNSVTAMHRGKFHVLVLAGPAENMFSFRVGTLTNPVIKVPVGSQLTINVVNVDDDMVHDLYITKQAPPYAQAVHATAVGSTILRPYNNKRYEASTLVLTADRVGTAYYVCTVPGHAKKGMWGKIEVTQ